MDLILTMTVRNSAPTEPLNLAGQRLKGIQVNHDHRIQCKESYARFDRQVIDIIRNCKEGRTAQSEIARFVLEKKVS